MALTPDFDTFPEAFNYCREADHPVVVFVCGDRYKLYPSGTVKLLDTAPDLQAALEQEQA